jgi:glucokinase
VLNLEMYVIGGGVVSAWDAFAPIMFQELRERSVVYAATAPEKIVGNEKDTAQLITRGSRKTIVTRALLGSDAGLFGAARLTTA